MPICSCNKKLYNFKYIFIIKTITKTINLHSIYVTCITNELLFTLSQFVKTRWFVLFSICNNTPCITHPEKSYPSATRAKFGLKLEVKVLPEHYPEDFNEKILTRKQPENLFRKNYYPKLLKIYPESTRGKFGGLRVTDSGCKNEGVGLKNTQE